MIASRGCASAAPFTESPLIADTRPLPFRDRTILARMHAALPTPKSSALAAHPHPSVTRWNTPRLERRGLPRPATSGSAVSISAAQLGHLLEGIEWRNPVRTWQPPRAADAPHPGVGVFLPALICGVGEPHDLDDVTRGVPAGSTQSSPLFGGSAPALPVSRHA